MAYLYISEYDGALGLNGAAQIPVEPPLTTQKLAIGAETKSAPFNENTKFIGLSTDAICSFKVGGSTVTATTSDRRLPADTGYFCGVTKNNRYLSVISNT